MISKYLYFKISRFYLSLSNLFMLKTWICRRIRTPISGYASKYSLTRSKNDILEWIRIRGSMAMTNGSGSCYFRHWPSRFQQKTNFLNKFFCLLLLEGTFTPFFKDKKSKTSHKTAGIKVFLTIFASWYKDPDPYLWLMDPDPGGPKSYGSGPATLLEWHFANVCSFLFIQARYQKYIPS